MKVPPGQAGQRCRCARCNAQVVAPTSAGHDAQPVAAPAPSGHDANPPGPPAADSARDKAVPSGLPSAAAPPVAPAATPARRAGPTAEASKRPADVPVAEPPPPTAASPQEFGFECRLCRTRLYARPEQIGQEVTCPDCHSKNKVKPPKPQTKTPVLVEDDDDGLQLSEPVERLSTVYVSAAGIGDAASDGPATGPARPGGHQDVIADQARQVLAKAAAEVEEVERATPRLPDRPFVTGLVSFLFDVDAVLRWLMLTLMLHADVALLKWIIKLSSGPGIAQMGALLMTLGASLLGLAMVAIASACFLAILQDTANGYDKPEHWPGIELTDWMLDAFYVVNGLLAAALPGLFLGGTLMCLGGKVLSAVYGGAISTLALFPVFLISMVTEGSCFAIASPAVWGTLQTSRHWWGKFYLISAGLGLALLVLARWMASGGFFLTGLGAAAAVAVMMVYFRLLGRLAWCLSEQKPS